MTSLFIYNPQKLQREDANFREALEFAKQPQGVGLFYWDDNPNLRRSVFFSDPDAYLAHRAFIKAGFLHKPGYGFLTDQYHMCEYYHNGVFIPYPEEFKDVN